MGVSVLELPCTSSRIAIGFALQIAFFFFVFSSGSDLSNPKGMSVGYQAVCGQYVAFLLGCLVKRCKRASSAR